MARQVLMTPRSQPKSTTRDIGDHVYGSTYFSSTMSTPMRSSAEIDYPEIRKNFNNPNTFMSDRFILNCF